MNMFVIQSNSHRCNGFLGLKLKKVDFNRKYQDIQYICLLFWHVLYYDSFTYIFFFREAAKKFFFSGRTTKKGGGGKGRTTKKKKKNFKARKKFRKRDDH